MKKWTGTFSSIGYSFIGYTPVYGEIEAEIADEGTQFSAPCKLIYMGTYNYGQKVDGNLKSDGAGYVAHLNNGYRSKVTFTVTKRTNDRITGSYGVNKPWDYGTFVLIPASLGCQ